MHALIIYALYMKNFAKCVCVGISSITDIHVVEIHSESKDHECMFIDNLVTFLDADND